MKPQLFRSLKGYQKSDLLRDLMAGLMVAIIALPLSIALGIQSVPAEVSNYGIQYGIITAIVAGFFISALGGSKHQIGGPTAAFVVILFGYLADPKIGVLGLAIAGMMAGVLLIVMGFLKFGNVMKFFPYPITIGFTTGIGVTLLVGQIKDFCGFTASGTETFAKLVSYAQNIATFDLATFGIGVLGLLCVILLPKISKKIPAAFVALIVCTGVTLLLNGLAGTEIATIGSKYGEVKAGFFPVDFKGIKDVHFGSLIVPAIVIAFLCAIESLLSATVAAGMTGTEFDANQELVGQGAANIFSSLLGGLPATGAIARTAASIENGARSPLAGMFHSVFLLIMYFALMGVMKFIPLAVFSAILISVAINMSRFPLFIKLSRFGVRDVTVLLVTFVLTVAFDLTYGVLGGVAVTFLVNAKNLFKGLKIEKIETAESDETDETGETAIAQAPETVEENETTLLENNEAVETAETVERNPASVKTVRLKVSGALFFLNANKLAATIAKELETASLVVVDMKDVDSVDETALEKLVTLDKKIRPLEKNIDLVDYNEKIGKRFQKYFDVL